MSPNAGVADSQPLGTAMHALHQCTWSPNKLWRSNPIFNLCPKTHQCLNTKMLLCVPFLKAFFKLVWRPGQLVRSRLNFHLRIAHSISLTAITTHNSDGNNVRDVASGWEYSLLVMRCCLVDECSLLRKRCCQLWKSCGPVAKKHVSLLRKRQNSVNPCVLQHSGYWRVAVLK
jgi:hypothetical protein